MRSSRKILSLAVAVVALFALASGQGAVAGGNLNQGDGQFGQPTTGVGGAAIGGSITSGCDTLDATATLVAQSRNTIKYTCSPNLNLTNWSFESGTHPDDSSIKVLHARLVVSGKIPNSVADFAALDSNPAGNTGKVLGVNYVMFFQNLRRQNARQITSVDSLDCQQHGHMGPYLSGNDEWLAIDYSVQVEADNSGNPSIVEEAGWAHYDPTGLVLFSRPQTGASPAGLQKRCVFDNTTKTWRLNNGLNNPGVTCNGPSLPACEPNTTHPGSRVKVTGQGTNTLDLYVPMDFHWSSLTPNFFDSHYVLADTNDTITGAFPQVQSLSCLYCVPAVYNPANPTQQLTGPTYLKTNPPIDWAPWGAYDLGQIINGGTLTIGTASITGPRCSQLNLALTGAGTYRQFTRGTLAEGDTDNEVQINPLYAPGTATNGLNHYDSSGETTLRDAVTVSVSQTGTKVPWPGAQQDHGGPTACNTKVPGTQAQPGSGLSFTV